MEQQGDVNGIGITRSGTCLRATSATTERAQLQGRRNQSYDADEPRLTYYGHNKHSPARHRTRTETPCNVSLEDHDHICSAPNAGINVHPGKKQKPSALKLHRRIQTQTIMIYQIPATSPLPPGPAHQEASDKDGSVSCREENERSHTRNHLRALSAEAASKLDVLAILESVGANRWMV